MQTRKHTGIHFVCLLAILGSLLLSACGPSIPRAQAEQELGAFMLDYLIREQMGGPDNYTRTAGQPWSDAPEKVAIIVWAPPVEHFDNHTMEHLNTDMPRQVWWFAGAQLTEVTSDKAAAVQDYRDTRMARRPATTESSWGWGYFEYGILSLSNRNHKAQVYVGISCGPLCGTGTIYTLERGASGKWEIRDSEREWIS